MLRVILLQLPWLFLAIPLLKGQFVQGPFTPSQVEIVSQAGSSQSWRNTSNSLLSDNAWAITADSLTQGEYTDYLVLKDFGFSLPDDAQIFGIEVVIECHRSSGNIKNFRSRIVKNGTITSTDMIAKGLWPRPSDDTYTHGGASSDWGESWTFMDINSPDFGYAMAINMTSNDGKNHTALVDAVSILVYYDIPMSPPLLPLKAQWAKNGVALQWTAINLLPEGKVILERAGENGVFEPIMEPIMIADSLEWGQFSWLDSLSYTSFMTSLLYRVYYEGPGSDRFYSPQVSVQTKESSRLAFSITPGDSRNLQILYTSFDSQSPLILSILNSEGKQMGTHQLAHQWGSHRYQLKSTDWSPGIYYLHLSQENTYETVKVLLR